MPRVASLIVGLCVAIAAASSTVWWWLMPHGFPFDHPRFWTNSLLPLITLGLCGVSFWKLHRRDATWTSASVLALACVVAGAAVTSRILFLHSMARISWLLLALTAALAILGRWAFRQGRPKTWVSISVGILAAGVGGFVCATQRAPMPDTHPLNETPAFSETVEHPTIALGSLEVMINPDLTFDDFSPDGCWTLFNRAGSPEVRHASRRTGDTLESYATVDRVVHSHLNTFCRLTIQGHSKLGVGFSPCPGTVVDVLPADYPIGRPARFAFLDADGIFHVMEARSGEKGPFRELARGPMARSDALTITLYDAGHPAGKVVLDDWAVQADTSLSPTAGWGVTMNSIEFQMSDDDPASTASIWITLGGTSVGRGWDSVGHAAGTYRNRLRITK